MCCHCHPQELTRSHVDPPLLRSTARTPCLPIAAGITCGFIGQGVANSLMLLKRAHYGAKEDDVAVPPLVRTALVWGMFMVS